MFLLKFLVGFHLLLHISAMTNAPRVTKHPYTYIQKKITSYGRLAGKDQFPMVAAVIRVVDNITYLSCGATIVTERAVLTAASCVYKVKGHGKYAKLLKENGDHFVAIGTMLYQKRIKLGIQFISHNEFQMRKVKDMIFHKNMTIDRKVNIINVDLVVLVVKKRFWLTDQLAISRPYQYDFHFGASDLYKKLKGPEGKKYPMVGYGHEDNDPKYSSKSLGPELGYINLKLVEDEYCEDLICGMSIYGKYLHNPRNYCGIDLHNFGGFCAISENTSVDGCFGRKGDPYFLSAPKGYFTLGVYSFSVLTPRCEDTFGMGDLRSPTPFVFTRVEKIHEIIEQMEEYEKNPTITTTITPVEAFIPPTRNFGRYAQRAEFPMVASVVRKINDDFIGYCGASILSETQVLTSAMCIFNVKNDGSLEPKDYETHVVLAGSEILDKNPDLISEEVVHWTQHQYWSGNKKLKIINLDILIGTVHNPFQFTRTLHKSYIYIYEPEELDETINKLLNPNGPTCNMLGWGYDRDYTKDKAKLRVINVKLMANVYCQRELCKTATPNNPRNFCNFDLDKFGGYCAVSTNRSNKECFGLGGDPLVCMGGYTFGFFSFSPEANDCGGRANLSYPNPLVFTRVERIKETTQALKIKMYNHSSRFFSVVDLILFTMLFFNVFFLS